VTPPPHSIAFEHWRSAIQLARSPEELLVVVAAYLGAWRAPDIEKVPPGALGPLASTAELMDRAVQLRQIELGVEKAGVSRQLIGELSLTISQAASRMRYLLSLQAKPTLP
jgi:hypothetical protein